MEELDREPPALLHAVQPVVNVCKKNAAHRVWKGCGKFFSSAGEALAGYKSPEMRTIIRVACNLDG